jgi:hypothetical protein
MLLRASASYYSHSLLCAIQPVHLAKHRSAQTHSVLDKSSHRQDWV